MASKLKNTEYYFGACPKCGGVDGMLNVGRNHWFYCEKHGLCWSGGYGLFTIPDDETEANWRSNAERLSSMAVCEPLQYIPPLSQQLSSILRRITTTSKRLCGQNETHFELGDDVPF